MDQIIEYRVDIYKNEPNRNEFKTSYHNIALQNDEYIVLDNHQYTRLCKHKKNASDPVVNDESIYERNWGIKMFDGISYTMYADHKIRPETIKNQIERFIQHKYGWLTVIRLDFIQ